ncbi:MAG TPA: DsbA family protein [Solirubrobacterales bacterium]|nr:DsbA family protein [Solirubrobacterales bacterium]
MTVEVRFYSDPACPWSWAAEPALRRLMWEFDGELEFAWVMGGLARRYGSDYRDEQSGVGRGPDCFADLISHWLDVAAEGLMPTDPRIWKESPLSSTYPACQAVKAAAEQGWELAYRYLRRLREGIMCERRKLDHPEALLAAARGTHLDRARFEIDLFSEAITEAFGADLDEVRDPPQEARDSGAVTVTEGRERISFPSVLFIGNDGSRRGVWGDARSHPSLRDAALAAGARQVNDGPLEPLEAIQRFGRCATRELELFAERPLPVLEAELWSLARDWKLKPVRALTGTLWEAA